MDRAEVMETLRTSRLESGDGSPTVDRLYSVQNAEGNEKYVVCNGVDGNPNALTARLLLEGDPHAVLEGMLITAYAVGAGHCIIVADNRWTAGIARITKALEQIRRYGLTGEAILGSSFSCEVEIREAAPSLVAGDETALLRFLEGKQTMPALRPSNDEFLRLLERPCLVDTVETAAKVSALFRDAPAWFAASGEDAAGGTRILTLSGDVRHAYTVEVPLTTTIGTIVEEIGGGVAAGRYIKAVQIGGPTGSFLGPDELDLSIESVSVDETGSGSWSASIEVFDTERCAVEMTEERMVYLQAQSCGKCVFCREGTLQMADILGSIAGQGGTSQDPDLLRELGEAMRTGCICAVGRTAANPVLSSLKLFRHDYDAHIKGKKCPATDRA